MLQFSVDQQAEKKPPNLFEINGKRMIARHVIEWDGTKETAEAIFDILLNTLRVDVGFYAAGHKDATIVVGDTEIRPGWTFIIDGAGFAVVPPRNVFYNNSLDGDDEHMS